ncbi:UNVERIFIED_CONTAM: hypothetical protein FKN15_018986 [Acipenser sinensis]
MKTSEAERLNVNQILKETSFKGGPLRAGLAPVFRHRGSSRTLQSSETPAVLFSANGCGQGLVNPGGGWGQKMMMSDVLEAWLGVTSLVVKSPCLCSVHLMRVPPLAINAVRVNCKPGLRRFGVARARRPKRKLDCPIRGCLSRRLVRLDRHFQRIHGLNRSDPTYPTLMAEAKGLQAGALLVGAPEVSVASLGPPPPAEALLGPALAPASLGPPPPVAEDSSGSESEEGPPSCGRSRRPTASDPPCLRLYLEYLTGPKPTSKKRENSVQAVQHVRLFLGLMADVSPGEAFADNLTFLKDTERCQLWFSELLKLGWAPTTVHCYLTDVANFLHYLLEARLPGVCPRKKQLKALLFSLNAFRRAGRRELTQHRQKVAELGQQRLIPKMNLKRFDTHANELIPDLLRLAETGVRNGVSTLIGLICGKLIIHNGHRRGVLMNMTAGEVEGAKCHENQFHVRVYEHKTTVKYGAAVLVVSAREHGWLLRFSALRATLPGYNRQPATFFFTSGGKPIANMGLLLSKAWRACGIGEWVTAGMIRSAVATYTWSTHGEVSKTTVSRHMTHSLQTQAAFYVLDEAPSNHQQARRLIEQSLDICESDSPESPEMASA